MADQRNSGSELQTLIYGPVYLQNLSYKAIHRTGPKA